MERLLVREAAAALRFTQPGIYAHARRIPTLHFCVGVGAVILFDAIDVALSFGVVIVVIVIVVGVVVVQGELSCRARCH
jgi:uncharacterized membrane protein YdcZ (DUF606 family)